MRNLNDFVRALGGIHNVLSGIAGKIDLIPVPGGGGAAEWTAPDSSVSLSSKQTITVPDGVTEICIMCYCGSKDNTIWPLYLPWGVSWPSQYSDTKYMTYDVYDTDIMLRIVKISDTQFEIGEITGGKNVSAWIYMR